MARKSKLQKVVEDPSNELVEEIDVNELDNTVAKVSAKPAKGNKKIQSLHDFLF